MIGSAIVTRNLVKRRGKCRALDGLTLSVPRGSVLGLVGENGAGKTTWMMTVAGFLRPNAGEIDILGCGPFEAERHSGRIAILPQDSELPLEMSPYDALYRFGRLQGLSSQAARRSAQGALAAVNLSDRSNAPVRTLSHGMRKRAMVAQCFVGNPEIVLLDEPLNGLDPVEADRMRRFILAQRGRRTVVVSSHNLEDVERLCSHVALIGKGRLVRMDTLASITHWTDRIAYTLVSRPADFPALTSAVPGISLEWREDRRILICSFIASDGGVAEVNRILLPAILAQTDVLSVTPGQSLEEAFLVSGL
ncbi:MAG: ABC transporter ATP-binding protein [Lentisphaerae bacterium]|nr:ABC transporter ATP-binding protein [Lentisphaerota bacterium]